MLDENDTPLIGRRITVGHHAAMAMVVVMTVAVMVPAILAVAGFSLGFRGVRGAVGGVLARVSAQSDPMAGRARN